MRPYISGPISGAPELDLEVKKERFNDLERWLSCQGDVQRVLNPLNTGNFLCPGPHTCNEDQHYGQHGPESHSWECYMRHDIMDVLEADAIVMLPRWEASPGAIIELNLAIALKYRVFHAKRLSDSSMHWEIEEKLYTGSEFNIPIPIPELNTRTPEETQ